MIHDPHNDSLSSFSGSQFELIDGLGVNQSNMANLTAGGQQLIVNGVANNQAIFNVATNLHLLPNPALSSRPESDFTLNSLHLQTNQQREQFRSIGHENVFDVNLNDYDSC